jgi:hypothetical protein
MVADFFHPAVSIPGGPVRYYIATKHPKGNPMKHLLLIASLVATSAGARAEPPKPDKANDAGAAFARLKELVGEWEHESKGGKARISYELAAGGSALLERESMPNMPPMLTVYYVDGDRLLLTHYCMAGNQPRMQARRINAAAGEIDFDFLDATNLPSPAAGHMHSAKVRLADNNHFSSEWTYFENGEKKFSEAANYSRVR